MQGLLELAGLPYVGAGVVGSAAAMDKAMMKRAFRAEGLPMMDYAVVRRSQWRREPDRVRAEAEARLGYPMFVKPANLGSSVGVHRIDDASSFPGLVEDAAAYDTKVLIERRRIDCHEIECAVLGNDDPRASVAGEIVPSREFYDYDAKYVDEASELVIPAPLPPETAERVRELAVAAFRAVEARGLARVDFFVERGDERRIHVNEVNTMPGFTPISMYPKLWEASGIPYSEAHRPAHPARHRGAPRPPRPPRRPVASDSGRAPRAEPPENAGRLLDDVLIPRWRVDPTVSLYRRGLQVQSRYKLGFYDALIVAGALEAGCKILYSEDLPHGRRIAESSIVNPFGASDP